MTVATRLVRGSRTATRLDSSSIEPLRLLGTPGQYPRRLPNDSIALPDRDNRVADDERHASNVTTPTVGDGAEEGINGRQRVRCRTEVRKVQSLALFGVKDQLCETDIVSCSATPGCWSPDFAAAGAGLVHRGKTRPWIPCHRLRVWSRTERELSTARDEE